MALPFTRSTRALRMDRQYPALTVLVIALLLFGLWSVWFFWAPITLYETGQVIGATRRDTLLAAFPAEAGERVQPGQSAVLRPQGALVKSVKGLPALVMNVRGAGRDGQFQVEIAPLFDQRLDVNLSKDFQGQVEVAVEQISPAQMVWRASGQGVDTAGVLTDRQTR